MTRSRAGAGFALAVLLSYVAVAGPTPSPPPDASPSVRGLVNTKAQVFGGLKTFDGGLVTDLRPGSRLLGNPFCSTTPQVGKSMVFDGAQWCATSGPPPLFEVAPATTLGMGAPCSGTIPTGTKGEALTSFVRASVAECYSNDGQTLTQLAANYPRISSGLATSTTLGLWTEGPSQNDIAWARDLSNGLWVKTSMTCTKTATGMRADANGASTCTATGSNATVCYTVTAAAASRASSWHLKRRTGTGAVTLARNGASYSANIAASLSSTLWRRAVPNETPGCGGGNCIVVPGLVSSVLNPQVCLKLATSGDAVDIDFVQDEASQGPTIAFATSPIATAGSAVPRAVDIVTFPGLPSLADAGCVAATFIPEAPSGAGNYRAVVIFSGAAWPLLANDSDNTFRSTDGTNQNQAVWFSAPGTEQRFISTWTNGVLTTINSTGGIQLTGPFTAPMPNTTLNIGHLSAGSFPAYGVIKLVMADTNPTRCLDTQIDWIGDSIVSGELHTYPYNAPPIRLGSMVARTVVNAGASGNKTADCSSRWVSTYRTDRSNTLIWSCGVNDFRNGLTATTAFANASAVWNDALAQGKRVVITGTMPFKNCDIWTSGGETQKKAYNVLAAAWAAAHGQTFISTDSMGGGDGGAGLPDPDVLSDAYNDGDNLHPNAAGALVLAGLVFDGGVR